MLDLNLPKTNALMGLDLGVSDTMKPLVAFTLACLPLLVASHETFFGLNLASADTTTNASAPQPPAGFRAIFNGTDLTGWHGLNPHGVAKLTGEKKEANLAQQRSEFPINWTVENGELVNDGHGPYASTDEEFGDIELLIEYKTVAGADSGIYLRGLPQVQIWDWHQVFDPKNPTRRPHLGSGGLFNNTPATLGLTRSDSLTSRLVNGISFASVRSALVPGSR